MNAMNEEGIDRTIGDLPTLRPDGPFPEEEPMADTDGWDPSQTIGELETLRPKGERELMVLAGRYRAVKRLGEGGMGSVWLAEDTKLDGRLVAIKMLPAVLAGKKGAYRQVKQEALMAMKLSHPNIATVRAFEEDEGGAPFLVMDYIEGEGLDEILSERGPLGEEEVLKLLGPVAAALDYAHSQGVVHRDVKPGNVMVRKDGTPFVLDFGIAREIQETMTRVTGKFSSETLLYMSPEQLNGRAPKAAQDVYSFAVMAYECLTGTPLFSRGQIEWQIVNNPPEPLPEDAAGEALRECVMAGLAKEPEKRPKTCMGVLGIGGASRPGEPLTGMAAGTAAGRSAGDGEWDVAGKAAGATARPEGSPHQRPTARPLLDADAATAGRGDENVFLRKVRVGRALEEARQEKATAAEKAELERIQEVFAAAEEALKAGRDGVAGGLFVQAEEELEAWRKKLATRRQRAQEEAEEWERQEAKARRAGATKTIVLPGGTKLGMVWCPAGTFKMGSPGGEEGREDYETQHQVKLTRGFWMGETEVTQGLWREVMGDNPSIFKNGDNYPVENVSWEDCQKFVQTLNSRYPQEGLRWALPTEAQWEYACRAGTETAIPGEMRSTGTRRTATETIRAARR